MSIIEDVVMKSGSTPQVQHTTRYVPTAKMNLHPSNPRFIKDRDFDILCDSIKNNPEFFEARPLLCTPDLVVFAGNMRLRAANALKLKHVPVIIMDVDEEKQRELMIRDNVNNGQWDTDALAAMFEIPELAAWGMPEFTFGGADEVEQSGDELGDIAPDDFTDKFSLPDGDRAPFQQITFTLSDSQAEAIKRAIFMAKQSEGFENMETFGNENSNGNALYYIIAQWAEQRT